MFRNLCLYTFLLVSLILTSFSPRVHATDKVVLQLKWEHEFQFAGYYAALWQGYYEREGLDVEIRSAATPEGQFLSPREELTSGRADFAIGGTDVFISRGQGLDLKVLSPIFQRSPGALFALEKHPTHNVEQASKLRIAAIASDDTYLEARAMFFMNGIDPERVQFVDAPVSIASLLDDKADAIVTYGISARIRSEELGLTLNSLSPSDHGIQFYGDMLYTSGQLAREQPELAEKFLRASLNGWRYALEHRAEIAQRIAKTLPRHIYHYDDFQAYNRKFAQLIDDYTYYPVVDLGHVDYKRWQRTYEILERLGEIERPYDPTSLLFSKPQGPAYTFSILIWAAAALLILIFALISRHIGRGRGWQISVLLLVLLVEQGLEAWHRQDVLTQRSAQAFEQLATVRSKLEQVLARNLAELNGVAAFIAANPNLSQEQFAQYANNILKLDPQLINLAAAPNLIVKYIYPRHGNEAVIGLDYRKNPQQFPAVIHAIESKEPIIAGPVDLIQGDRAFIGRSPISVMGPDGELRSWGIVSAPIDVASVYREAGLLDPELGLKIAIRGKDGSGSSGEVFYGHPDIFTHPEVVKQTVSIGGGSWQIGAIGGVNADTISPRLILIRSSSALFALLIALLLFAYRRNRESQKHYQAVLRRHAEFLREVETVAKVGGWRMDESGIISELSAQARTLLNLAPAETRPSVETFTHSLIAASGLDIAQLLRNALHNGENVDLEVRSRDGKSWFRLIGDPLQDSEGHAEIVGAIQDITEKKIADAKIERQANYDSLTDLPNRELFRDRLETAMALTRRTGCSIALLFVDLDHFKAINDNYGHREGDLVLQESARRIRACIRESDTVGRHSGDEFTVILHDVSSDAAAEKIASKLVAELGRTFKVGGAEVHCGASVGIAFYPGDASSADNLVVNADQAMYEVKKSGRNGWHFYTEEMQSRSEHRHHLYNDLVTAIRDDELTVHLQPIVATTDGRIVGCEALARWQRQDGSWLPPTEFIPLAEETGLVNQIDYLIMTKATSVLHRINETLRQPIKLSINVSPRLFHTKDQALDHWMQLVRNSSKTLPITVEITERLLIEESERTTAALLDLAEMGVGISIDDFGTGYSSLSYLTRFPVTGLKIDRSFVNGIGNSPTAEPLIETILAMASKLGLTVVAEGVETAAQLEYLTQQQCGYAQGYFLGRPMPIEEFEAQVHEEETAAVLS
ncbi:EAL domain-containing protein [Porticoccus sp.]